jgi:Tol biopolymer transport system component
VGFSDLTADGRLLVFTSNRSGTRQIWSKDLGTGSEQPLTAGPDDNAPVITADGSRFVYQNETQVAKYEVTLGDNRAQLRPQRKIAEGNGWPTGWSPDGSVLFFSALHGPWAVDAVNRTTGSRHRVYGNPAYDVTYFRVSPDGAWAVSSVFDNGESYIRVARLRNDGTVLPEDWIRIASDAAEHDRPMWSATGNLIYYTSSRDGFRCIWAQHLDPVSKRAAGAPEAVYHSHSAGLSLRNSGQNRFKLAVAPDRLVFNMGELRGNLWMATIPEGH